MFKMLFTNLIIIESIKMCFLLVLLMEICLKAY